MQVYPPLVMRIADWMMRRNSANAIPDGTDPMVTFYLELTLLTVHEVARVARDDDFSASLLARC